VEGFDGFALVVERGPRAGMTFVLHPGSTTVGRHPDSDIFLDDVTVSRHHCRFTVDGEGLRSRTPDRPTAPTSTANESTRGALSPGDEVLIGRFHLIVAHGDG
jgi:hypothetical protein